MLRGSLSLSLSVFMSLSYSFSLFLCLSLPWPIHTLLLAQFLGITLVIPITVCNSLFSIKAQKCQLDTTPWQLPPITKYIYIPWGFLETDQHCWAYSPSRAAASVNKRQSWVSHAHLLVLREILYCHQPFSLFFCFPLPSPNDFLCICTGSSRVGTRSLSLLFPLSANPGLDLGKDLALTRSFAVRWELGIQSDGP